MGIDLPQPILFEWDEGNQNKSYLKHEVTTKEAEQVFLKKKALLARDSRHSYSERRYLIIGLDYQSRLLSIAFTIRKKRVRVISARPASKRERIIYEKASKITKI